MKNTGKSTLAKRLCALALFGTTFGIASANVFNNGSFSAGFAGWSANNTPNGVGAPGTIEMFDIDGPGFQGPSPAAHFVAGRETPGVGQGGVVLTQQLSLIGGREYRISCDTATLCSTNNPDGGKIELIVNQNVVDFVDFGGLLGGQAKYRRLEGSFVPQADGTFFVGARITRHSVPEPNIAVNFFVDNFDALARIQVEPRNFVVTQGFVLFGGLQSLFAPDNNCLGIMPDSDNLDAEVIIIGESPIQNPTEIVFTLDSMVGRRGLVQQLSLRNYQINAWVPFNGQAMPGGELVHVVSHVTNATNTYVGPNGRIEAKVLWRPINDEDPRSDGWIHCIDFAHWTIVE